MRDTAIERRSLTSAQRIDIILRSSDLIDEIAGQAESNKGKRNDLTSGSAEPEVNKETNIKLAELAKTSKASVVRMKKVKKESPELYR